MAWVAEQRIREAVEQGKFDDLPLKGRPLDLDAGEAWLPPELRMAYKVLKDAGCVPPEVELRKEISTLAELLRCVGDEGERVRLTRALNEKWLRLRVLRERRR